jgi:hypothetical protein
MYRFGNFEQFAVLFDAAHNVLHIVNSLSNAVIWSSQKLYCNSKILRMRDSVPYGHF